MEFMNIKNLEKRVREINKYFSRYIHLRDEKEYEILAKTVKLNEEVGELCNDILSILKLQRKSKLERFKKSNIYQEFADVIIATLSLASISGVDVERALNDKLNKLENKIKNSKHSLNSSSKRHRSNKALIQKPRQRSIQPNTKF